MTQVIYRVTIDKKYGLLALKLCSGVRPLYYILGMSIYSILGLIVQEIIIYIITLAFEINIAMDRFFIQFCYLLLFYYFGTPLQFYLQCLSMITEDVIL